MLPPSAQPTVAPPHAEFSPLRFQRSQRLLQPAQFSDLIRSGRRISGEFLALRWRDNGLSYPRLGLTIPKRYLRRAVDRNRLKRLIREHFRLQQHQFRPVDLVVMLTRPLPLAQLNPLCETLSRQWAYLLRPLNSSSLPSS